jgi:hypothetical protein
MFRNVLRRPVKGLRLPFHIHSYSSLDGKSELLAASFRRNASNSSKATKDAATSSSVELSNSQNSKTNPTKLPASHDMKDAAHLSENISMVSDNALSTHATDHPEKVSVSSSVTDTETNTSAKAENQQGSLMHIVEANPELDSNSAQSPGMSIQEAMMQADVPSTEPSSSAKIIGGRRRASTSKKGASPTKAKVILTKTPEPSKKQSHSELNGKVTPKTPSIASGTKANSRKVVVEPIAISVTSRRSPSGAASISTEKVPETLYHQGTVLNPIDIINASNLELKRKYRPGGLPI